MEKKEGKRGRLMEALGARDREIEIPEKPGPSILGREPLVGMIRRAFGIPVIRDEMPALIEISR